VKKITLICFLLFITNYLLAQTLADSVIVKELNLFAKKNYNQSNQIAEAKEKAEKALELSKKIKYYKGEINSLLVLEAILTLQNKAEDGEKKLDEAQKIAEKIKALPELATCYHTKAYNSYLKGNHAEALELHEKALKIRLQLKDDAGIATVYNSIGNINNSKGNLEIAMEYYMKAMAIREKLNDQAGMSAIFNNLGNVAFNLTNYRQALDYYEKSYKIKVEQNDKKGMAASLVNVASAYKKLGEGQKSLSLQLKALANYLQINQFDTALFYYQKSIKIREQTKEEQNKIIAQLGVANAYIKKNNLDSAWHFLNIAVNSAKKIGAKREERDSYRLFSDFYYLKGEFKSAFDAYRNYSLIKDSLLSEERTKAINKMQAQYDNLQKEKENELLRKENALTQVELERKSLAEKQLMLQAEQDKQNSLLLLTENKIKATELSNSELKNETQEKENLILKQQKEQQKTELLLHEEAIRFQQYFMLLACGVLFFSIYFTVYI